MYKLFDKKLPEKKVNPCSRGDHCLHWLPNQIEHIRIATEYCGRTHTLLSSHQISERWNKKCCDCKAYKLRGDDDTYTPACPVCGGPCWEGHIEEAHPFEKAVIDAAAGKEVELDE